MSSLSTPLRLADAHHPFSSHLFPQARARRLASPVTRWRRCRHIIRRLLSRPHLPHRDEPRGQRPASRAHLRLYQLDGEYRGGGRRGLPLRDWRDRVRDEHQWSTASVSSYIFDMPL